jgi:hypothetical protein
MSVYVVPKAHIDALVATALDGPADAGAPAVHQGRCLLPGYQRGADALGRMLWLENLRSVAYRHAPDVSGYCFDPVRLTDEAIAAYTYQRPVRRLTIVAALKALQGYRYQACECPDWEASDAASFCRQLESALISALPGYDDAPWAITE